MSFLTFILEVIFLSLGSAISYGALNAAAIGKGSESRSAGVFIALGLGVVEVPLMLCLFMRIDFFNYFSRMEPYIFFLGGIILFLMAIDMFREARGKKNSAFSYPQSSLWAGGLLTAGNPFFFVWWSNEGTSLIARSRALGTLGFPVFAVVHWLCILGWFFVLSFFSYYSVRFFGTKYQRAVFFCCSLFFMAFSFFYCVHALEIF